MTDGEFGFVPDRLVETFDGADSIDEIVFQEFRLSGFAEPLADGFGLRQHRLSIGICGWRDLRMR